MRKTSGSADGRRQRGVRSVVRLLVVALVALLLAEATATGIARLVVSSAQHQLSGHLVPAQEWTQQLSRAFVDQETGQRGYLLTGSAQFLQPYAAGQRRAALLEPRLRAAVPDQQFQSALAAAVASGDRWRSEAAQPEIAARQAGPIPPARLLAMAERGKHLFDELRTQLDTVNARANELVNAQLRVIGAAQRAANIVSIVVIAIALLVAVAAPFVLRRVLDRPLERLMHDLDAASRDDHHREIVADGPEEVRVIAAAAERMRAALVRNAADLVAAERRLTLFDERDRMAADLHDHTIQQVFALGLALSSAASRATPDMQARLEPLIDDTEHIIRRLRGIIFDLGHFGEETTLALSAEVVTRDATRALGFEPTFTVDGPVDQVTSRETREAALAVLREMLSNVARHARATEATVCLSVVDGQLVVQARDNGVGIDTAAPRGNGLANLRDRADRFGGDVRIERAAPSGTIATWRIPV